MQDIPYRSRRRLHRFHPQCCTLTFLVLVRVIVWTICPNGTACSPPFCYHLLRAYVNFCNIGYFSWSKWEFSGLSTGGLLNPTAICASRHLQQALSTSTFCVRNRTSAGQPLLQPNISDCGFCNQPCDILANNIVPQ